MRSCVTYGLREKIYNFQEDSRAKKNKKDLESEPEKCTSWSIPRSNIAERHQNGKLIDRITRVLIIASTFTNHVHSLIKYIRQLVNKDEFL